MPRRLTPETRVKRAIKMFLKSLGIFNFPILQGMGAYKGICDIIALHNGIFYAIEVKGPRGTMNADQIKFMLDIEKAGGVPILARSIDDLIEPMGLQKHFFKFKFKRG